MLLLGLLLLSGLPSLVQAQQRAQPVAPQARPRVGIALSGGSAKGFAHIGVLRVLEELGVPVHAITGTSMGSVMGGLYAIGHGPDALQDIARGQDWASFFADRPAQRTLDLEGRALPERQLLAFPIADGQLGLPSGLATGQRVSELLLRLTWGVHGVEDFAQLPIPFAAVATDLETGAAVVLSRGFLADAMRASMSLPGVFRPVSLDGRLLVDGGLARNLPAQDVRRLGADFVICSDVSDPLFESKDLRSIADILLQTTSFQMNASTDEQRQLCDILIQPELDGLSSLDFDRTDEWVARGEAATRLALAALSALTERADTAANAGVAAPPAPPDTIQVGMTEFTGLEPDAERVARAALRLPDAGDLSFAELERGMSRAYDTGLFERLTYRVTGPPTAARLTIAAREGARDLFGFGFRYDSRYKASLLLGASLSHWLRYGSSTRFDLRLGEELSVGFQHLNRTGVDSRLLAGVDASYARSPFEIYDDDSPVAEVRSEVATLSGFLGTTIGDRAILRFQIKGEHANSSATIGSVELPSDDMHYTLAASFWHDTRDQLAFPTRGTTVFLKSEWADDRIGSGATFAQHLVDLRAAAPLTRTLTFRARAVAGSSTGPDLPLHYRFFMGGWNTSALYPQRQPVFFGLDGQERAGRAVQLFRVGLQYQIANGVYGTLWANAGNTFDRWEVDVDRYLSGFAVSLGTDTVVGPIEVTVGGRTLGRLSGVEVNLGYRF